MPTLGPPMYWILKMMTGSKYTVAAKSPSSLALKSPGCAMTHHVPS